MAGGRATILGDMGYTEKLQRLCALRGFDQSRLAERIGISKSSMSRILNGTQEPKLRLAQELARVLGVTLDYLVNEEIEDEPTGQLVAVTEEELLILKLVRRLGADQAIDRLIGNVPGRAGAATARRSSAGGADCPEADKERPGPTRP
jgi:transcriptional regulator with XRE-family HTH domain